ncbi:MAG: hypothetical protein HOL37_03310, partial [Rhodospirillaceae bacterium]|nr:hypothetical protein [Rhodospirillaceae bacterium]
MKKHISKIIAATVSIGMLSSATPAPAQQVANLTPSTGNVEIVASAGNRLQLEVSKGRLVRLERPAATVFVADPEVANIQVKSPSLIYVLGKKPGETTLFAVDGKERVLANIDISVTHNLDALRGVLENFHPNSGVQVSSISSNLVLDGVVSSASVAEDMRRLALGFAGDEKSIINRLGVAAPNQINLRVRVAEVSRDVDKQFGFNWSLLGSIGGFSLGL